MGNFFSELFGTLFLAIIVGLIAIALSNSNPESQKREELIKHNYTQAEVDSIISKENNDFLNDILTSLY